MAPLTVQPPLTGAPVPLVHHHLAQPVLEPSKLLLPAPQLLALMGPAGRQGAAQLFHLGTACKTHPQPVGLHGEDGTREDSAGRCCVGLYMRGIGRAGEEEWPRVRKGQGGLGGQERGPSGLEKQRVLECLGG